MDTTSAPLDERPSPLLSVPTEVMEMIATFADDEFLEERPLSKLRLTCRQLRDQLGPEFAQRYLSEPFIMMSRYSLEALIDICRHPVFGPRVRKVRLHSYTDMTAVKTFVKETAYGLSKPAELSTVHHPCQQKVEEAVDGFIHETLHLRSLGEATKLLKVAFSSLAEYGTPIILCLETFWPYSVADRTRSAPIGFNDNATNAFREALNWVDWNNPLRAKILQNLLELADESGCKVQGIEIHDFSVVSRMYDHSWHDSLEIHHRLIPDLTTAQFKGYSPKSRLEGSMALLRLINQMKKLSSLSLGNQVLFKSTCVHYIRDDIFLGQIQLPALQVLDLNGMEMSLGKLQRFLVEHKHTLKQVHLQNLLINIPAPGDTWLSRIMGWIRDNIALHRVTLGDIRVILDNDWQDSITKQPGVPIVESPTSRGLLRSELVWTSCAINTKD